MFLVVYDIQCDKLRARFAKALKRYGERVQYSVFKVENKQRILNNLKSEINQTFEKQFGQGDSVLIFDVADDACVGRFGYPVNEETDLIIT